MAVCVVRGWVFVADTGAHVIAVFNLSDGGFVKTLTRGKGSGNGQLHLWFGGLCLTPWRTVLVADAHNNRVVEVDGNGSGNAFLRVLGAGVLHHPRFVDCELRVVAVSQHNGVVLLSMTDGSLVRQLAVPQLGEYPISPLSLALLHGGAGVAVAELNNGHLFLLGLDGSVQLTMGGLCRPYGVLGCDNGRGFLVSELGSGMARCCVAKLPTSLLCFEPYSLYL